MGALSDILSARNEWRAWSFDRDTKVLLLGHSNGGQGAWYVAGRYPDRVVGGMRLTRDEQTISLKFIPQSYLPLATSSRKLTSLGSSQGWAYT